MVISITNTHGPILTTSIKVLSTKVKERNLVAHGGLYVGNKDHHVRDGLIIGIGGNATAEDATCALNDPQMIANRTTIHINPDMLRTEGKEIIQEDDALTNRKNLRAI